MSPSSGVGLPGVREEGEDDLLSNADKLTEASETGEESVNEMRESGVFSPLSVTDVGDSECAESLGDGDLAIRVFTPPLAPVAANQTVAVLPDSRQHSGAGDQTAAAFPRTPPAIRESSPPYGLVAGMTPPEGDGHRALGDEARERMRIELESSQALAEQLRTELRYAEAHAASARLDADRSKRLLEEVVSERAERNVASAMEQDSALEQVLILSRENAALRAELESRKGEGESRQDMRDELRVMESKLSAAKLEAQSLQVKCLYTP